MSVALLEPLEGVLHMGAAALGVGLDARQETQLLGYLDLLDKWNAVYNLSAVRERQKMLTHHVLDSLAIVPLIRRLGSRTLLDVGSGAGLPGLVLAIAIPELAVTLVDAVQKKTAFLTQVKGELGLSVRVNHARVEALTVDENFDCIASRAFSSLSDLVRLAAAHIRPGGVFVAMKGAPSAAEIAGLPAPWQVRETLALTVPGLHAARCALVIGKPETGTS